MSGQFGFNAAITAVSSMMGRANGKHREKAVEIIILRRQRNRRKGAGRMGDAEEGDVWEESRVKKSSGKRAW